MNGDQPRIEIFEPFGAALEVMKRILFQPFDFTKWLVIGFAAFLSGSWGGGFQFNVPSKGDWNFRSISHSSEPITESLPAWLLPFVAAGVVLICVIALVLMWISARGRFIFTDCVVKNRAAIVVPWKEYRREGNSFFLFSLAVMFLSLLVAGAFVVLVGLPLGLFSDGKVTTGLRTTAVFALIFAGLVGFGLAIFFGVVTQFMVAVMYRQRCRAREAFFNVSKLMLARPGSFILFVLFGIVLVTALLVVGTIATCMTCCLAGLPYISSVVLLPAFVWLLAFKLLFLRQFGPEYDVWWTPEPLLSVAPVPPSDMPPPPVSV